MSGGGTTGGNTYANRSTVSMIPGATVSDRLLSFLRFVVAESGVDLTGITGVREFDKEDGLLGIIFELTTQVEHPYIFDDSGPPFINICGGGPPSVVSGNPVIDG